MTTKSTPTHLRLELADQTYEAPLLTDEAPASIAALEEFLPLESDLLHVRWSGHATWVNIDEIDLPSIPRENHTAYPSAGDILLYPGYKNDQEILLACGPTSFKSPAGDLAGNHVATVDASRTELRELEQRTLQDGAQGIELSLVSNPE
ncbi:DUF3830 family protein [Natrialbaceae archaeon A-arb3/5]